MLDNAAKKLTTVGGKLGIGASLLYTSLFVFSFAVFSAVRSQNTDLVTSIITGIDGLTIMYGIPVLFVGYAVLNYPMLKLIQLMYRFNLPDNLLEETLKYRYLSDPEEKARLDEEDRILKLADEIRTPASRSRLRLRKDSLPATPTAFLSGNLRAILSNQSERLKNSVPNFLILLRAHCR